MRLGALLGPVTAKTSSKFLPNQARFLADQGFESLWSAQAIGRGFMVTDPFVALTAAASVTENIEIGSAVVQAPLYHPLDLAHRVLSLQQICGDRLTLGLGVGSTEADFSTLGRNFDNRFENFTSIVEDLREIFRTGDLGEHSLSAWPEVQGGRRFISAAGARASSGRPRNSTAGSPPLTTARPRRSPQPSSTTERLAADAPSSPPSWCRQERIWASSRPSWISLPTPASMTPWCSSCPRVPTQPPCASWLPSPPALISGPIRQRCRRARKPLTGTD